MTGGATQGGKNMGEGEHEKDVFGLEKIEKQKRKQTRHGTFQIWQKLKFNPKTSIFFEVWVISVVNCVVTNQCAN